MISLDTETIITFQQAVEMLPRRRRGQKTHISTLYRWSDAGCRGVRLETIQIGATRCTSREALQRFFNSLSASSNSGDDRRFDQPTPEKAPLLTRTAAKRQRAAEEAARQLERLGV